jgi:hypothetical protein
MRNFKNNCTVLSQSELSNFFMYVYYSNNNNWFKLSPLVSQILSFKMELLFGVGNLITIFAATLNS